MFQACKARTADTIYEHAHRIAGKAEHLADAANRANTIDVIPTDIVFTDVLLGCKKNEFPFFGSCRKRFNAPLPSRIKMQQLAGQHNQAPQRDNRDMFINFVDLFHCLHSFFVGSFQHGCYFIIHINCLCDNNMNLVQKHKKGIKRQKPCPALEGQRVKMF